jgi:hypothetical protein
MKQRYGRSAIWGAHVLAAALLWSPGVGAEPRAARADGEPVSRMATVTVSSTRLLLPVFEIAAEFELAPHVSVLARPLSRRGEPISGEANPSVDVAFADCV